jgi:hypothetical protein
MFVAGVHESLIGAKPTCRPALRMSVYGGCCRKSRKSNDVKNLANVDFWMPLQCSLASIRRSVVVFLRSDVVPHVATTKRISSFRKFSLLPPKDFFDSIDPQRTSVRICWSGPHIGSNITGGCANSANNQKLLHRFLQCVRNRTICGD